MTEGGRTPIGERRAEEADFLKGGDMIWKWLGGHWLDLLTALGILAGLALSLYNFIIQKRTIGRKLDVKVTYGQFRNAPDGLRCMPMLFIDVANIGYTPATIDAPYFILRDGKIFSPPESVSEVRYPRELNTCKRFSLAAREADIRHFYGTSCGYKGEVLLYGAVKDQAGIIWKSKKPWRLGLRDGKQKKRGNKLELKASRECEGNLREYRDPSTVRVNSL